MQCRSRARAARDEDLARLRTALDVVQEDLNHTVPDAPLLQILVLGLEHNCYHFTAYVGGPGGTFCGGGSDL